MPSPLNINLNHNDSVESSAPQKSPNDLLPSPVITAPNYLSSDGFFNLFKGFSAVRWSSYERYKRVALK